MSQTQTSKQTPAVIVFGQTDKGIKHAAWFSAEETASAKRAAALRSLSVLDPIPDTLTDAVAKIARGRFVVGQISLTKVAPDVFDKLQTCSRAETSGDAQTTQAQPSGDPNEATKGPANGATGPQAPAAVEVDPWQQIKVGDVVLAEYSKEDGWWEARVIAIEGDLLRLSWCDGSGAWREVRAKAGLLPRRI